MKKRNKLVDILKGIGICLIVLGHTQFFAVPYIYLFHVAIFIIASGMFYHNQDIKTIKEFLYYIKKQLIRLYLPYVIVNLIWLTMNNILLDLHIYSLSTHEYYGIIDYGINALKILLFRGNTELCGATWFLHLLFLVSVLYTSCNLILNKVSTKISSGKDKYQLVLSIIFLVIGFIISKMNLNTIFGIYITTLNCYWLFFLGIVFNTYKDKIKENNWLELVILICIFLLVLLKKIGSIELSKNIYTSPLFFVICSILGWILLYLVSMKIEKKYIGKVLSYLGQKSLYILMFHFIGFKIFNVVIYIFIERNINILSGFPVAQGGIIYSVIYFVFGITISLLLYYVLNFIKGIFSKIRSI